MIHEDKIFVVTHKKISASISGLDSDTRCKVVNEMSQGEILWEVSGAVSRETTKGVPPQKKGKVENGKSSRGLTLKYKGTATGVGPPRRKSLRRKGLRRS